MFKKFFGLTVMLLVIASNCFAMTFYQPVKIGFAGVPPYFGQNPKYMGGYFFEGTSYNDGNILRKAENPKESSEYGAGLARWGDGKDALYCKYQAGRNEKNHYLKFGGKDSYLVSDSTRRDISKIETDEGITLYVLYYRYNWYTDLSILGCLKDGTWVKYIDTSGEFQKKYFGDYSNGIHWIIYGSEKVDSNPSSYIICKGDTIIIPYNVHSNSGKSSGEFRFKWDDAAQWFGVEQIVY